MAMAGAAATMASSNVAALSLDRAAAPAASIFSRRLRMPARSVAGKLRLRGRGGAVLATSVAAPAAPAGAEEIVLQPIREISGAVQLPGSKSLSNRILLLSALSEGTTVVDNLLNSEDVHYMLEALDALGLSVEADKVAKRAVVVDCGGRFPVEKDAKEEVQLFLGNAGTAMRPLTAAVVAAGGNATYASYFIQCLLGPGKLGKMQGLAISFKKLDFGILNEYLRNNLF